MDGLADEHKMLQMMNRWERRLYRRGYAANDSAAKLGEIGCLFNASALTLSLTSN